MMMVPMVVVQLSFSSTSSPLSFSRLNLNLKNPRIALGRYGGPVALLRDDRKPVRLRPGEAHAPAIRVASAAGHFFGSANGGGATLSSSSFSTAGSIPWTSGMVAGMAWSEEEDLVVVGATTGQAHVFPLEAFLEVGGGGGTGAQTLTPRVLTLGADAARDGVAAVAFWGDGLVAMTKRGALVALDGFSEPRVEPLPSPLLLVSTTGPSTSLQQHTSSSSSSSAPPPTLLTTTTAPPLSVLPPAASPSGSPRAITAAGRDIVVCDARSGSKAKATMGAPVAAIAVSPCGGFVAAADWDARLVVWSSDFSRALSEFATQAAAPPDALAWCGSDSVVMLWKAGGGGGGGGGGGRGSGIGGEFAPPPSSSSSGAPFAGSESPSPSHSLLLMVGPFGDWVKYDAAGVAAVSTEPDGLRILSSTRNDLLRRVPDALADALRPGSTSSSAALRDARRALDGSGAASGSSFSLGAMTAKAGGGGGGALGALRALRRKALPGAAVAAADAARSAVKPSTQEELLKAAALGVAFALGGDTTMDAEDDEEEEEDEDEGDGEESSGKGKKKKKKRTTQASATRAAAAAVAAAISEIRVLRAAREVHSPLSSSSSSSTSSSSSSPGPALALTSRQFELLGAPSLVGRLARRGYHLLALRAAKALGCSSAASAGVAAHWAAAVISSSEAARESDEALAAKIRSRIEQLQVGGGNGGSGAGGKGGENAKSSAGGVRYGALATVAAAAGRRTLAAALLEAEPVPRERVPLLLRLGDGARALDAALGASDPDLISTVLLRPRGGGILVGGDSESAANAAKLVQKARSSAAARAVLARVALDAAEAERVGNGSGSGSGLNLLPLSSSSCSLELKTVERVLGPSPAAALAAEAALSAAAAAAASAVAARREGRGRAEKAAGEAAAKALDAAADAFSKSGLSSSSSTFSTSANVDVGFYASAASEGASLRRLQASLEASTGHAMLVGLSASETLLACLRVADGGSSSGSGGGSATSSASSSSSDAAARRVRAELRLSDRRWAWARLRSRVEAKDWGAVEAMAVSDAVALAAGSGSGRGKGGGGAFSRSSGGSSSRSSPSSAPLPAPILAEIARMCRRAGAPDAVVLRLFSRFPDDAAKVEALASAGLRRDAARVAARLGEIGGGGGNAGSSNQNAEDLLGRLQGVLSFGRGLVGGGR